ncbi:MAG TPA: tetratricopeptide repeat protein [Bacteroidales bacterium]|nr:tetratricopeptide repeat protein [Bacteroidales bacterium]
MNIQSGNLIDECFDHDDMLQVTDPDLDARIKSYRKAQRELEQVMNDPFLEYTRNDVASFMQERNNSGKDFSEEIVSFIKTSLEKGLDKNPAIGELKEINEDAAKSDINDLSAEWVREWHRKKQMSFNSPADEERRSFIAASLSGDNTETIIPDNNKSEVIPVSIQSPRRNSRKILRYSTFAAAAAIGAFITVSSLVSSGNPESIYRKYYKDYDAVVSTTRGSNTSKNLNSSAMGFYKEGNFVKAEEEFSLSAAADPASGESLFFLGLSQIETGKTDEAVRNLTKVVNLSGVYTKEAHWYLGLIYLKIDNKSKASEHFRILASSDGYYRGDAGKILRRLE